MQLNPVAWESMGEGMEKDSIYPGVQNGFVFVLIEKSAPGKMQQAFWKTEMTPRKIAGTRRISLPSLSFNRRQGCFRVQRLELELCCLHFTLFVFVPEWVFIGDFMSCRISQFVKQFSQRPSTGAELVRSRGTASSSLVSASCRILRQKWRLEHVSYTHCIV